MGKKVKYISRRTMAYIIDCLIVFGITMLVFQWWILSSFRSYFGINELWFHSSVNMHLYVILTISLPVWLYFSYFDSNKSNGTIGKKLFGLKLVRQGSKNKLTFNQSFVRAIIKLLPWEIAHVGVIFPEPLYYVKNPDIRALTLIGLFLFAIYFISIILDKKFQSIYDKIIRTQVLNRK